MKTLIEDINKIVNEETRVNGYYAVELTEESKKIVARFAEKEKYPVIQSHHVTIAYKPLESQAKQFEKLVNKKVRIQAQGLYGNDRIRAFVVASEVKRVDPGPTHITISHVQDAKPVESNNMISRETLLKKVNIPLEGIFKFIPSKPKKPTL